MKFFLSKKFSPAFPTLEALWRIGIISSWNNEPLPLLSAKS